jgi:hypothetical protein
MTRPHHLKDAPSRQRNSQKLSIICYLRVSSTTRCAAHTHSFAGNVLRPKKNTWGSGSRPTLFFLPTLLFFQRDWPCDPIFSGWLRAAHTACQSGVCCHTNYWTKLPKFVHRKYASLVNIDVGTVLQIAQQKPPKPWKKYSISDPNFFTIWNRNHGYFIF